MPKLDRNANNKQRLRRNAQRMRTEALFNLADGGGLMVNGDSQLTISLDGPSLALSNLGISVAEDGIGPTELGIVTTKGDLLTFDTAPTRLPVGADGLVLTADDAEPTGLKWAAFTVNLISGGGLQNVSDEYGILLDGGTLSLSGSGLRVAADGIGKDELGILTTKGDLVTFSTEPIRLGVGSNGQVLSADSASAGGMKWASVLGASGGTLAFYGGTEVTKPTVTGLKGGNLALGSLLTALAGLGLVTDSSGI